MMTGSNGDNPIGQHVKGEAKQHKNNTNNTQEQDDNKGRTAGLLGLVGGDALLLDALGLLVDLLIISKEVKVVVSGLLLLLLGRCVRGEVLLLAREPVKQLEKVDPSQTKKTK